MNNTLWDVIVCGGGAAGCLAAMHASQNGCHVLLLEQNDRIGKKIYITGKGRCNFTNAKPMQEHLNFVHRNPKFLYSAYNYYTVDDFVQFLHQQGIKTKTERGDRMFPESDKSVDIMNALDKGLRKATVHVEKNTKVKAIAKNEQQFEVQCQNKVFHSRAVILATGGASYPTTGSTGDGYSFAEAFGHTIQPIEPALTGINLHGHGYKEAMGVSLRNVTLHLRHKKKRKEYFGEMLITHFGISGPIVLQLSAALSKDELPKEIHLDFKPALDAQKLDARLLREIEANPNMQTKSLMRKLLPQSLIPWFFEQLNVSDEKAVNQLTSEERQMLIHHLKHFPLSTNGYRGFQEAIITRGGVNVKEVNSKTMESKRVPGLFFCGELLDLHADTGGYNLQIAWSTGALAGKEAYSYLNRKE